ncbi:MAG TPA: thioredoxin domain-containing protein [Micropepsaceae bacterium]|nr:thioredoxin domain-containing protein [Micropepsaceae bacterium]
MSANLLNAETSPYLLQHKDNPVHWRPWGPDALAEAERLNRPVLVSVGYAACHWCHVMAHESFEDPETAELMNELYVSVKVDREERPDVDNWLQKIPMVLGKPGGWPLTVFLTPKGEPFWGGTYFPKEESFGRPSFKTVLREIANAYRDNPDTMGPNIRQIAQHIDQAWYQNRSGTLDIQKVDRAAMATAHSCDIFYGGLTGAPKFPNVPTLELLWRAYLRLGQRQFRELSLLWIDMMGRGGIYDHVGGGFARYATDEQWLIPHFEKMLYDNAPLIDMMTLIWQHGRQPVLKQKIEETVGWVLREMLVEGAGLASSLDADSEGEEGKFYVWTEAEIDEILAGTPVERFKRAYGVTREGNFPHEGRLDGKNILHRIPFLTDITEADEAIFVTQKHLLFEKREKRVRPGRDDKVLTDWNGMMIAALANAGSVFGQYQWVDAARRAFRFICDKLGEGDQLYHSYRAGKRQHPAISEGYANMTRAALALWEATSDRQYLDRAIAWTKVLDEKFWDVVQGGYVYSKNPDLPDSVRTRTAYDSQVPSANGIMVGVMGRLFYATADQSYAERANTLIQAFAGDVNSGYMQMATYLNNYEFCTSCLEIIVFGPPSDSRTQELIKAALGRSLPNKLLMTVAPGEVLPPGHPAEGKYMQEGQPTAYICGGSVCSPPVTSAAVLSTVLQLPENSPMNRSAGNA